MKLVLICGGFGTKMWPESREANPKHFLPLVNGKSLFQYNWDVLAENFPLTDIFLQTNPLQAEIAKSQAKGILDDNIFIEPEMRNQGPATGFAAAMLFKRGFADEPFMLVQADDMREPKEAFIKMITQCDKLERSLGKLITGGIKPKFFTRGVDYLVPGAIIPNEGGLSVWSIAEYVGRDEEVKIKEYIDQEKIFIHCNHYCWTPKFWLETFKSLKPEWYEPLMNIVNGASVEEEYSKMPKGPVEEVTNIIFKEGYFIELPFEWIDFGTWESLDKYNSSKGLVSLDKKVFQIEANNAFVRKSEDKVVAIIGINDLVVIDTQDALLICPKNQSAKVKDVVQALKDNNLTEYL